MEPLMPIHDSYGNYCVQWNIMAVGHEWAAHASSRRGCLGLSGTESGLIRRRFETGKLRPASLRFASFGWLTQVSRAMINESDAARRLVGLISL